MEWILWLGYLTVSVGIGYWLGVRHTRERAEEEAERMRRIEPLNRQPGLPTNLNAPPSHVSQPRMRRAQWRR